MWTLLVVLISAAIQIQAETRTVDLTESPAAGESRVPGTWRGAIAGGSIEGPPTYPLPLSIELEDAKTDQRSLILSILVTNNSAAAVVVPVSRDAKRVHRDGNLSRRRYAFEARLTNQEGHEVRQFFAASFGSSSVPESTIRLAPKEQLRIRFAGRMQDDFDDMTRQNPRIDVICSEWEIRDDVYSIVRESKEVFSQNSLPFAGR